MENGTLITGIIIVLIMTLPFVFVALGNNKKKQKKLNLLNDLALKNRGQITEYDVFKNKALGLDRKQKMFYALVDDAAQPVQFQCNLNEVSKCEPHKKNRTEQDDIVIEQLKLEFVGKNKDIKNKYFELFDTNKDTALSDEVLLLEKWAKLINEIIH